MRRTLPLLCLLLSASLAAACSSGDGDGTPSAVTEALTDGGSYRISYTSDPSPIPLNEAFDLTLTVELSDDLSPLTNSSAVVDADANMPAHGHGMNTAPEVYANGDGTFLAEGFLFHMEGDWQLVVDVTVDDITEQALFDVPCCQL